MHGTSPLPVAVVCDACGTEVGSGLLACPGCHRLVHAETLHTRRQEAAAAAAAGDVHGELVAWRAVIALLPERTRQRTTVDERIAALAASLDAEPAPDVPHAGPWRWLGGLGVAGLFAWKFKFLIVALATKGKLLVLGLTKASTAFSMLLSVGVYWTAWGLWFAAGLVLSIYVHEMGHVAALRRYGVPASAPMFVPGLGAFVRLRAGRLSPLEDARIGLAGPLWGLGATLAALVIARVSGSGLWLAVAHVGAWLNLFNLLPVWQLDGNRGFAAISRAGRVAVAAAFTAGWLLTGDGLFLLLIGAAALRGFASDAPDRSDTIALTEFVFLVIALAVVLQAAR